MKKLSLLAVFIVLLGGCSTNSQQQIMPLVNTILPQTKLSEENQKKILKLGDSFVKSIEDITPEQEYYIGRTVSAKIFSEYQPYKNQPSLEYVTLVGNQLSYHSDMPITFGGYHFQILNSDEINAFAAPGGFIFITRGMLRCAQNEDQLAAILAHEIAHITNNHGLKTIKTSRWTEFGSVLAVESAKQYSKKDVAKLVSVFENSINDVVNNLMVKGYSREYEYEADATALKILEQSGYDPKALSEMLHVMESKIKAGDKGFGSTHPLPSERISSIKDATFESVTIPAIRNQRFSKAMKNI